MVVTQSISVLVLLIRRQTELPAALADCDGKEVGGLVHSPEKSCPCGSGRSLANCCIPEEYPIAARGLGYQKLHSHADGVDLFGRSTRLPPGLAVEVTFRNPTQLDISIEETVQKVVHRVKITVDSDDASLKMGAELQSLSDSLYAVRFHQRQCLRRLRAIYMEHLLLFRPPTGNVKAHIDDMPFRYEFEAFIIRLRTCLDVLGRVCSLCLGKQPDTFGSFLKVASSSSGLREPHRARLNTLLDEHTVWLDETRKIRNALAHESDFKEFQAIGYDRRRLLDPSVASVPVDHLCFRTWANLLKFIWGAVDVVVEARQRA